jgi:DNA mismatch endonuclease, patch repair protein
VTYWKGKLDRNVARDAAVDAALIAEGWRVLRVWEHESIDEAVRLVETALATSHT